MMTEKVRQLEDELHENRVETMRSQQHWMTLKLLFQNNETQEMKDIAKSFNELGVQVNIDSPRYSPERLKAPIDPTPAPRKELQRQNTFVVQETESNNLCLESQLKQAMLLASNRSALLLEAENRLAEAQGRVKVMERSLEEKDRLIKQNQAQKEGLDSEKRDENVFSVRY